MRIKQLRQDAGLTQRQFADLMGVTQPSVVRWENGKAEMTSKRLQQAASVLECTPDEILGIRRAGPIYAVDDPTLNLEEACWGSLRIRKGNEQREFPISFAQRDLIAEQSWNFEQHTSWLQVATLSNKLLLLNLDNLDGFDLVTDDEEAAPDYERPEVYLALSEGVPHETASLEDIDGPDEDTIGEEVEQFLSGHSDDEVRDLTDIVKVHYVSGQTASVFFDLTTFDNLSSFTMDTASKRWLELSTDGGYIAHATSLSRVAMIEVPLARFRLYEDRELSDE